MSTLIRRPTRSLFPEMFDWLQAPLAFGLPFGDKHPVAVEELLEDDTYVLRAELPGCAREDIDVSVADGRLTVTATREESKHDKMRSELRYGSFSRTVTLPSGAQTDTITASYDKGILQITVPITGQQPPQRVRIDVESKP